MYRSVGFISQIEPKKFEEANEDPQWIMGRIGSIWIQVWTLVKRPANYPNQVGIQKEAGSKSQKQGKTCGSRLQGKGRDYELLPQLQDWKQ